MAYGTHVATKRLGKRVQQAAKVTTPNKRKDHAKEAEDESKLKEVMRSLQIAHDPRYKVIDHYKESDSSRLENMIGGAGGKGPRYYPEPWGMPEPIGKRSAYNVDPATPEDGDAKALAEGECSGFKDMTLERFKGRIAWEESFKSNVKQIMVDFSFSNDPSCRLNHLDRMSDWFCNEGKKQSRKDAPCPNYIKFEKCDRPLPGSARGLGPASDSRALDLAGIMHTPARKRVERQFGARPGMPGGGAQTLPTPRGGYK